MRFRRRVFITLGPWGKEGGDPEDPVTVVGVAVTRRLIVRSDAREALVALADGRFALTGRTLAVGPAAPLTRHLRRRALHASSLLDRRWLQEAAAALADQRPRRMSGRVQGGGS